jgi:hypothetical protein
MRGCNFGRPKLTSPWIIVIGNEVRLYETHQEVERIQFYARARDLFEPENSIDGRFESWEDVASN